jgi:hypothetical protein
MYIPLDAILGIVHVPVYPVFLRKVFIVFLINIKYQKVN